MSVIYFIFQQTMLFTIPLMVVALGGMFSERSGVVNIALEGIMTMGAFTGILFLNMTGGRMSGQTQLFLAILISAAKGAAFAFFHAYAAINMKAGQTISGTALNMFAPAFAIFVARVIQGCLLYTSGLAYRLLQDILSPGLLRGIFQHPRQRIFLRDYVPGTG